MPSNRIEKRQQYLHLHSYFGQQEKVKQDALNFSETASGDNNENLVCLLGFWIGERENN